MENPNDHESILEALTNFIMGGKQTEPLRKPPVIQGPQDNSGLKEAVAETMRRKAEREAAAKVPPAAPATKKVLMMPKRPRPQ